MSKQVWKLKEQSRRYEHLVKRCKEWSKDLKALEESLPPGAVTLEWAEMLKAVRLLVEREAKPLPIEREPSAPSGSPQSVMPRQKTSFVPSQLRKSR